MPTLDMPKVVRFDDGLDKFDFNFWGVFDDCPENKKKATVDDVGISQNVWMECQGRSVWQWMEMPEVRVIRKLLLEQHGLECTCVGGIWKVEIAAPSLATSDA